MEESKTPLLSPEAQAYVFASLGFGDSEAGRDLLLSLARRVNYARAVHPKFGGFDSVHAETVELAAARGAAAEAEAEGLRAQWSRVREEAVDVMATCVRLVNME